MSLAEALDRQKKEAEVDGLETLDTLHFGDFGDGSDSQHKFWPGIFFLTFKHLEVCRTFKANGSMLSSFFPTCKAADHVSMHHRSHGSPWDGQEQKGGSQVGSRRNFLGRSSIFHGGAPNPKGFGFNSIMLELRGVFFCYFSLFPSVVRFSFGVTVQKAMSRVVESKTTAARSEYLTRCSFLWMYQIQGTWNKFLIKMCMAQNPWPTELDY